MTTRNFIGSTDSTILDSDVILFVVWPYKFNPKEDPNMYQVFVAKNRNRAINSGMVECRIEPSRQMIVPSRVTRNVDEYAEREFREAW